MASDEDSAAAVIRVIRDGSPIHRSEIACRTGLSPSRVTFLVKRLLEVGIVVETADGGEARGDRLGHPVILLRMKYAIPSLRMAGGGVIVNISSTGGIVGYAGLGTYVASKWGVRGLTETAALELGRDNIRVVSVHHGPIRTPMMQGIGDEATAGQPVPRYGHPEEVTKMVLYLAADATFSTGSEFIVDVARSWAP